MNPFHTTDKPSTDKPGAAPSILTTKLSNGATPDGGGSGTDRKIEKKLWTTKRVALGAGVLLFVALVAYGATSLGGGKRLNVEREKLTVSAVSEGPFQEYISQTGNVMPLTTVYLDAVEGGRVEEVFTREGTNLKVGDPLLRLSNNDLQLRLLSADAQRIEQINLLEDMRFRMDQNRLSLRQQMEQMDYQIQRLAREDERNAELFSKQLISEQEYQRIRDELEYYRRTKDLTLQGFRQDSLRMVTQIRQMESSVQRMGQNYAVLQGILENLIVRAPVSGYLTDFDVEVGELRAAGSRFGQIDVIDGYKVRAGIDEFYISRVTEGQTATTQPLGGQEYKMHVTEVYPQVQDGRFEVDLVFSGAMPEGLRRGQTIRFRLELGDPEQAVLLPRGGFYQTTGGNWVYVVDEDGSVATKRTIRLGRQNPQNFEVLEGLEPGDRVITSSYDTFGDADRLMLN